MPVVLSVNLGAARATDHSNVGVTGIDKRPVSGSVELRDPGPAGAGGSGADGDAVCDRRHHGGRDQAVYAYGREDLDEWQAELDRPLGCGVFGENLTTEGVDVTGALIGERWQIDDGGAILEVAVPRIPCRTFAGWLSEEGWVRRFTDRGAPGAYLRVITPGPARAGDRLTVVARPDHEVTIGLAFRALTQEPTLLACLLAAGDALPDEIRQRAVRGARRRE